MRPAVRRQGTATKVSRGAPRGTAGCAALNMRIIPARQSPKNLSWLKCSRGPATLWADRSTNRNANATSRPSGYQTARPVGDADVVGRSSSNSGSGKLHDQRQILAPVRQRQRPLVFRERSILRGAQFLSGQPHQRADHRDPGGSRRSGRQRKNPCHLQLAARHLGQKDDRGPDRPVLERFHRHGRARPRRHRQIPGADGFRLHGLRHDRPACGPAPDRGGDRLRQPGRPGHLPLALARSIAVEDRAGRPGGFLRARAGRRQEHHSPSPSPMARWTPPARPTGTSTTASTWWRCSSSACPTPT